LQQNNNSKYKIVEKTSQNGRAITLYFERKKDAIAYLQEQREIWYSDFHNGAFGDCGKSFTSQVVYERGRKLQYDTRTIIVDVVVDVV
jgi:hypothetical protein